MTWDLDTAGEPYARGVKIYDLSYIHNLSGVFELNQPASFLAMLPLFFCAFVCLFAVVGGMLCKSDKPSIIIIII